MHFYFLKEDFEALTVEIEKIAEKIKEIGKEMGRSCQEGAETFHDNFAYEDGERQQRMWSMRIRELIKIRNQARVVEPQQSDTIAIGATVTVEDEDTEEVSVFKISSYMVLTKQEQEEEKVISYNSPLARLLMGGRAKETKGGIIAGNKKSFFIISIKIK